MENKEIVPDLRLKTVNQYEELETEVYEFPKTPDSTFVVDDSCFIPMAEAVAQLGSNNIGANDIKNYYDFPDGKDNGMSVPLTRTKYGKDIAEISTDIMNDINEKTEKLSKAKKDAQKKAAFEQSMKNLGNAGNEPSPSTKE